MSQPWYHEGLKFKCTGCGKCCTGSPGYVFLTDEDEVRLAKFLKMSIPDFQRKYTRLFMGQRSLIEDSKTYDCVFLKDTHCSLYGARPKQCRTYPFWSSIMESKEAWDETKLSCEGIESQDAPTISLKEIEKNLL